MLTHLHISNMTLVESLDIELKGGLTTLTGESGAGKSIMLDALGLALGSKTDADKVRKGAAKAEIQASFDLNLLPFALTWLEKHDLQSEQECILRRVISKEGRSRAYINGHTVPLNQLREFGDLLVDIHSQHEHQSLLKPATHQRLLDEYAQSLSLSKDVRAAYFDWQAKTNLLENAQSQGAEADARYQLLHYQVEELDQLGLEYGEVEQLEQKQKQLANADVEISQCQHALELCNEEQSGVHSLLHKALRLLQDIPNKNSRLNNAEASLNSALISVEEAQSDIESHIDHFEADPEQLQIVETRLSAIYDVARKHKVKPEALYDHHQSLAEELAALKPSDALIEDYEKDVALALDNYNKQADKLSSSRQKSAKKLAREVNEKLSQLAMVHANLTIQLDESRQNPRPCGHESIEFLISTHPEQPPRPLNKVASGGELSRISLAIQVVTAQTSTTPTLVFDEVDVGIGGTTGDVVGHMLRELGQAGQIFCVTHLAQVASKAHTLLHVEKTITNAHANSTLRQLEGEDKVAEIARMMGGKINSQESLNHARQILEQTT